MSPFFLMILAIIASSVLSLAGGAMIFLAHKRYKTKAILAALPFGAGALLAAAFFDLLPEAFDLGEPSRLLVWTLAGFIVFFLLERLSGWFHHHHDHDHQAARMNDQGYLVMAGDLLHNIIDGVAIGAAFVVSPTTGLVTTLAVSAHEIPKEIGTFGILLSRGWKSKRVILANIITALGTLLGASLVFWLGTTTHLPEAELLALAAGMFIYIAASDIIPDIHEQPRRIGTMQAGVLVLGIALVGVVIHLLGV